MVVAARAWCGVCADVLVYLERCCMLMLPPPESRPHAHAHAHAPRPTPPRSMSHAPRPTPAPARPQIITPVSVHMHAGVHRREPIGVYVQVRYARINDARLVQRAADTGCTGRLYLV